MKQEKRLKLCPKIFFCFGNPKKNNFLSKNGFFVETRFELIQNKRIAKARRNNFFFKDGGYYFFATNYYNSWNIP